MKIRNDIIRGGNHTLTYYNHTLTHSKHIHPDTVVSNYFKFQDN